MESYLCSRCGRSFHCEENISFCPFCGTAYAATAMPANNASGVMRIVVGSDGERTIQEKYWREARSALYEYVDSLYGLLPEIVVDEEKGLSLIDEETFTARFRSMKNCSSSAALKHQMDKYIDQLQVKAPEEIKAREPWNMEVLEEAIDDAGMQMAEVLGSMDAWQLKPGIQYDPDEIDESIDEQDEEEDILELNPDERQVLMHAVTEVKPAIFRLIDEHSTYAAFSDTHDVFSKDMLKLSPAKLSKKLITLSKKDYDPFFGESFEEFVRTFWQALCLLHKSAESHVQNSIDNIREKRQRHVLHSLIQDWGEVLEKQLDKAYQEQQLDMMNLYQEMMDLQKEMEKRIGNS